jgi:hypothetical protein
MFSSSNPWAWDALRADVEGLRGLGVFVRIDEDARSRLAWRD